LPTTSNPIFFAPFTFCTFVLAGRDFFPLALEAEKEPLAKHGPKKKEEKKRKKEKKKKEKK
jgi:hypothetical protein